MSIAEIILLVMSFVCLLFFMLESISFGELKGRYNSLVDKYNNLLHSEKKE